MARLEILSEKAISDLRADHDMLAHQVAALRVQLRAMSASVTDGPYEIAKVDGSGITAGSGTTPGTGTVTIYRMSMGGTVASSHDVNVNNWCGAIDADAYIGVFKDRAGRYWTANGRC